MRLFVAIGSLLLALILASPGSAQAPPDSLLTGTMSFSKNTGGNALCTVGDGPSSFKRNGGGPARVAFPEAIYASFAERRNAYVLSGAGTLVFSAATAGQIRFDYNTDYPPDIRQMKFSGYSQSYNSSSGALVVKFVMDLRGCAVRVLALYRL